MSACPCGSSKSYDDCCGVFISGKQLPVTPEQLVRSRYTAYTRMEIDYIASTMKPPASKHFDAEHTRNEVQHMKWLGLEMISSKIEQDKGHAEFIVNFIQDNRKISMHEISEFRRDEGQWFYISGRAPANKISAFARAKIGRNDPCPCGSNKKYKQCCGKGG